MRGSSPRCWCSTISSRCLDAAPLVADLRDVGAIASTCSATSRAPLRAAWRARVRRRSHSRWTRTSTRCRPPIWRSVPAVRLFVERVRDVQPDFRLTSANGSTVTAICRRLDALPLALELAAPWIKVLTAEDLLRRLERRRPAPDRRPARSPRTSTDDECDGRLELSAARPRTNSAPSAASARCRAAFRSSRRRRSSPVVRCVRPTATKRSARWPGLIDKSLLLRAETLRGGPSRCTRCSKRCARTRLSELTAAGERDDALEGLARYCTREASLAAEGAGRTRAGRMAGSRAVTDLDKLPRRA